MMFRQAARAYGTTASTKGSLRVIRVLGKVNFTRGFESSTKVSTVRIRGMFSVEPLREPKYLML